MTPRESRVAEIGVDGFASHQDERGCGVAFPQAGGKERPELRRRAVEYFDSVLSQVVEHRLAVHAHVVR